MREFAISDPVTDGEGIRPFAAMGIIARADHKAIVTVAAIQEIGIVTVFIGGKAPKRIIAFIAVQRVLTAAAVKCVIVIPTGQPIRSFAAF